MGEYVCDIEADGLKPTKIYCLSYCDVQGNIKTLTDYGEMKIFLDQATRLIFHYGKLFDQPVLEKLLGVDLKNKVVDTLAVAWYVDPMRTKSYGLESYGEELGIKKPEIKNWFDLPLEEYIKRCEEDVKINTLLWKNQYTRLKKIYLTDDKVYAFLNYLMFKMDCARLQAVSRWKLDISAAQIALDELLVEQEAKTTALQKAMPMVVNYITKTRPAKLIKKDGSLTSKGQEWFDLLESKGLPDDTLETEVVHSMEPANPGSNKQVKDWLYANGWVPQTFEYKDGREIPQINQKHGKGICPSIKMLYEKNPDIEILEGLSTLNHRIPILRGFLETQEDGYLTASIQGITNTLRFRHAHPLVNLPKPDRLYAKAVRSVLIADDGMELCGADMSSLEDRLKQHYIFPYDPGYVKTMLEEGYDPHLRVALLAGMMTDKEVLAYKGGDKSKSRIRDMAKNGGYAMQYGAFPPKLVKTLGISLAVAQQLFDGYWKLNWAIKKVASVQKTKTVDGMKFLYNPVSGFWYYLKNEKDIFSTLIQGTAAYVFDVWVSHVLKKRRQLTAQFHDEIVLVVKKGFREQATKYLTDAIIETNKVLKLNRELAIGIQFGDRYSEIH